MNEQKENSPMGEQMETPKQGNPMNPMQSPMMQNKNVWLLAAAALLVAAVFLMVSGGIAPTDEAEEMEGEEMQEEEQVEGAALFSEITLNEQNNSGQSGAALLTDLGDGTTRVVISAPSPFENLQPAHIHSGTCENLGGVVYPLANVEGGSSDTVVAASFGDLAEGTFAINIHMSAEQSDVYTACGNI